MKKLFNHTKRPVEDWKGYDENDYDEGDYDEDDYEEDNYDAIDDGEGSGDWDDVEGYYEEETLTEDPEYLEEDAEGQGLYEAIEDEEEPGYYEAMGDGEEPGDYETIEDSEGQGYYETIEDSEGQEYYETIEDSEEQGYYEAVRDAQEPEYGEARENVEEAEYYGETEDGEEPGYYGEMEDAQEAGYYGEAEDGEEPGYYGEMEDAQEAEYYGETEDEEEPGYYGEIEDAQEAEYYGETEDVEEPGYYGEIEDVEGPGYYGETEDVEEPKYYGETEDVVEAEYYGETEDGEEPEYYREIEDGEEPEKGAGFFRRLQLKIGAMSAMDKVIFGAGAAVLALAIVTGSLFVSSRIVDGQVADFASVGSQLDNIDIIGGRGLLAVADAELARMAAIEAVQGQVTEPPKEYQEAEYGRNITVSLNLTSVQKDLKIKFINKSNGKLVSNVPFTVSVTDSGGKSVVWSDDDMDGIIYKKEIVPGSYTVAMESLAGEKYSDYNISDVSQKVEVKKDIDYKKVDVANEIKKESEINAAKEDTKQNVTVVESTLPDTIEWVESKVIEATYNEVSKSSIPDPATLASAGSVGALVKLAEAGPTVSVNDPGVPGTSNTPDVPGDSVPILQGMTLDKSEVTVFTTVSAAVTAKLTGAAAAEPVVSATAADANVAAVSVSGTTVTVTGTAAGSTVVKVSYTENNVTVAQSFQVTVKNHPTGDRTTKLKDAGGSQLYVLENGTYREAVYADYYTAERFFVKGGAKYSGWQTIDGKVFYFTAGGEKVTGEQVIQGAKYNFASDGSLVTGSGATGIDVSKWNGNIDWTAVSNSGISYVIIRCGYRGSSQGKLIEDPKFAANIQGATAAGLKVGVYFFTQAVDEVEAVEEASMVLEQIRGYRISYPIFLDVEPSGGRADSVDRATRTAVCRAFCETIQDAGYTAGIYANKTWLTDKLNVGELGAYKIWLAQYAAEPTYAGRYDLWQYKSNGSVSGIKGKVDMNQSYLGY